MKNEQKQCIFRAQFHYLDRNPDPYMDQYPYSVPYRIPTDVDPGCDLNPDPPSDPDPKHWDLHSFSTSGSGMATRIGFLAPENTVPKMDQNAEMSPLVRGFINQNRNSYSNKSPESGIKNIGRFISL